MKENKIKSGSRNICKCFNTWPCAALLAICSIFIFTGNVFADINHYKNFLVGSRAALMGGAFSAIADDASGSFYNPAGIAFSYGDSISGSGNAYHQVNTGYKQAIGKYDYERESSAILPNFFGIIKKFGNSTFALSYVIPETMIEHQDQFFLNATSGSAIYYLSRHAEDNIYMMGPTYATKLGDTLSIGITLYYLYREYREQKGFYQVTTGSDLSTTYSSTTWIERGLSPKLGIQWTPSGPFVIGFTFSQTSLNDSLREVDQSVTRLTSGSLTSNIYSNTYYDKRDFPNQFTLGIAYYPSPFLLISADLDYYQQTSSSLKNMMNLSVGSEYYLDPKNALRFGFFTNNDNRIAPDASTRGNELIDMTGLSFGYSSFSRTSSVSVGMIYETGSGGSQLYGQNDPTIVDMHRTSMTMVFAASYNY